jgi:hypothetical protein
MIWRPTPALDEILFLCLGSRSGVETFVAARFGSKGNKLLRRFCPYRHGTPALGAGGDGRIAIDGKNFPPIPLDLIRFMLGGSYDDRIAVLISARARIARW